MEIKITKHALEELEQDMEPEELQEFLDELKKAVDDGSFFKESKAVNMELMELEEPELYKELEAAFNEFNNEDKLN